MALIFLVIELVLYGYGLLYVLFFLGVIPSRLDLDWWQIAALGIVGWLVVHGVIRIVQGMRSPEVPR